MRRGTDAYWRMIRGHIEKARHNVECRTNVHLTITGEALSMCRNEGEIRDCMLILEESKTDPTGGHYGK